MRVAIIAIILSVVLAGCQTVPEKEYIDRPVPVQIPIIVFTPEPQIIPKPKLAPPVGGIEGLDEMSKYYLKVLGLMEIYGDTLQCILDTYRTKTSPQCPEGFVIPPASDFD